ncbi:MAG: diacylglycerol/polyprenol kinase family protein [Candidatus Hodarchaeales archaeon]|jgi:dolichol kinase
MDPESKRKTIHIGFGLLTPLIAFLPRVFLILITISALFFIIVVARPTMWKKGFDAMASRERDVKTGYLYGPLLYILMVLVSVTFLDLRIAASVFCIMAFGDGFANVIGSRFGKHRYKRFQNKSAEGFLAFLLAAFISSSFLFFLVSMNPEIIPIVDLFIIKEPKFINGYYFLVINLIVCLLSALIELTTGDKINDNITVPIIAGLLLTFLLKF